MPDNPYDLVHYQTFPRIYTHPDRLAAIGRIFGLTTADPARCRVLELGCGDGGNLLPLAYALPGSRFTGIDLAEAPVTQARRHAAALSLDNLSLHAMDLRDAGAALGEFDYILAHGIYSWVPAPVRDALLAVCRDRLAPNGVALISYNLLPGYHTRLMLRDLMVFHSRGMQDPQMRIGAVRGLLNDLQNRAGMPEGLLAEIRAVLERNDAGIYHDDLAAINQPVYLHEFVEHAARHGLQYLGDADLAVTGLEPGSVEREQYLDFLHMRRFRHTLLCHEGTELREPPPDALDDFLYSSGALLAEGRWVAASGASLATADDKVHGLLQALADCYPLPAPFDDLLPYAGPPGALREILRKLVAGGFAELHVYDFPCEEGVTEHPRASRLARLQAISSQRVTNLCHQVVELDEIGRRLLVLLDGTRDHAAIARDLAGGADAPAAEIERHLPSSLEWMARMALLEA